jgi:metal-sulfur cluster biosynthetic enzyme
MEDDLVTKEMVLAALKNCYDPEIPINIVDLGLIYDIRIDGGKVDVDMTLTAPGCPMHVPISADARSKIEAIDGVEQAIIHIVWEPRWTPERMSDEARKSMGF